MHCCVSKESLCGKDEIYLLKCHFVYTYKPHEAHNSSSYRTNNKDATKEWTFIFVLFTIIPFIHVFNLKSPFHWQQYSHGHLAAGWCHTPFENRKAAVSSTGNTFAKWINYSPGWCLAEKSLGTLCKLRLMGSEFINNKASERAFLWCWYIYPPREGCVSSRALVFPLWIRHLCCSLWMRTSLHLLLPNNPKGLKSPLESGIWLEVSLA